MIIFEVKNNPLKFGIMYSEELGNIAESAWYESIADRDESIRLIMETGELDIRQPNSPLGRTVNVHSFTSVTSAPKYWTQI